MAEAAAAGPDPRSLSASELGRLLRVHRNSVRAWVAAGCPHKARANRERGAAWSFDLADVVRWREELAAERAREPLAKRIEALEAALAQDADGAGLSEAEARRRKRIAEAALLEHELAVKRGDFIPASDSEMALVAVATMTQKRILAVPHRTAAELAIETTAAGCFEIVEKALHEALHALADAAKDPEQVFADLEAYLAPVMGAEE